MAKSDDSELLELLKEVEGPHTSGGAAELIDEPVEKPKAEIVKDDVIEATVIKDEETPGQIFARDILTKYSSLYGKLIERSSADEQEIQDVLDFLKDKVFTDSEVPEHFVTSLAQTIQTKTNATTNTVRLLDNIVKIISAGKGSSMFGETKSSSTADMVELAKILSQKKYEDEHG